METEYSDHTVEYTVDEVGNRTSMTDDVGTSTWQFDWANRTVSDTDAQGNTHTYTYDLVGNQVEAVLSDGRELERVFDGRGNAVSQSDENGTTEFSFDADGELSEIARPSGVVTDITRDLEARITDIVHTGDGIAAGELPGEEAEINPASMAPGNAYGHCKDNGNGHPNQQPAGCDTDVLGFSYVYDERGLVTEREVVSEEVTTTTQYTHDDLGRLTESVTGEYVATYAWDAASNLIAETLFDDLDSNLAEDGWESTRTVNDVNQVTEVVKDFVHHPDALTETTSYDYDEPGNRVHEELTRTTGGTTHTLNEVEYSFDGQDQLVGLHDTGDNQNNDKDDTVVSWQRDGLGRALNVTDNGDSEARVFDGTAIVAEGDTRVTRAPSGQVLFEAFETVEGKNKKATEITVTREVLSDRLGSTVTFADGGVIDADLTLFSDFGDVLTEPDWDTVSGFTGMPDTAGLTEFATRAYDPASRVWVQEDTYPGTTTRASSMNRYAYVEGAPETYVDAWGMYRKAPAVAAQQLSAVKYAAFMVEFAKLSVVSGYIARWQAQRDAGPADTVTISVTGGAARVDADICTQSRECRQRMAIYATWAAEQTDISQIPTPSYWGVALAVGGGAACTAATGNIAVGSLCFAAAGAAGGLVDYSNNVDPLSFSTKDALVTAGFGAAVGAAAPGAGALIGKVNTAAATRLPVLGTCVAGCSRIAANSGGWSLPQGGGGQTINGRWYTEHALERMAPSTPAVMAQLEARAVARAQAKGLTPGTREFGRWWESNGPDPRNIPSMVVEAEIANPGTTGVKVITNANGDVVTVWPTG